MTAALSREPAVRWPLQPLLEASGLSRRDLATHLDVTLRTITRAAADGLSDRTADRWAITIGLHPLHVWGWDWIDAALPTDTVEADEGAA